MHEGDEDGNAREPLPIPQEKLDELVRQLDSNKTEERESSEKTLLELGPVLLDHLPPISDLDSDEFKMRYERIRTELDLRDPAREETPLLFSFEGEAEAKAIFQKLSEATGNRFSWERVPGLDRPISTSIDGRSFWEAFDALLDQLDLSTTYDDGAPIQFVPRPPLAPFRVEHATYAGVFRLEPMSLYKAQNLRRPDENTLSVGILLSWEPRLAPSLITFQGEGMELVTDTGEIFQPKDPDALTYIPVGGVHLEAEIDFPLPERLARKIDRWSGSIQAVFPGRMAAVSFSNLDKPEPKTVRNGMLSVTLENARKNRDLYEIMVGVALQGAEEIESIEQAWSEHQEVYMVDANGERIEHVGWSTTRIQPNDNGMTFLFELEDGLEGCKFVFRAPGSLHTQVVNFELKDIPLP